MIILSRTKEKGFSLIEVIISLVVFGVLAAIFVSYLGSPLQNSVQPIVRLNKTMLLQEVMENIRIDFKTNDNLNVLKDAVGSEGSTKTYSYDGGTFEYIVDKNRFIKFTSNSEASDSSDKDLLKVTLKNTNGDFKLTLLFSEW